MGKDNFISLAVWYGQAFIVNQKWKNKICKFPLVMINNCCYVDIMLSTVINDIMFTYVDIISLSKIVSNSMLPSFVQPRPRSILKASSPLFRFPLIVKRCTGNKVEICLEILGNLRCRIERL